MDSVREALFSLACVPLLQYLGKTHNYWHGATLLLEDRANTEGELILVSKEPPAYDGNYTEEILDPLKHVSPYACLCCLLTGISVLSLDPVYWLLRSYGVLVVIHALVVVFLFMIIPRKLWTHCQSCTLS